MVFTQLLSFLLILIMIFCSLLRLSSSQVAGIVTVACFAFAATTSAAGVQVQDGEASALLKWKATLDHQSHASLSSWITGTSPCTWKGIVCDESRSVSTINVTNFGLKGTLDGLNLSSFPKLLGLDTSYNSFNGSIPVSIVKLANLSLLNLSNNQLSGSIPPTIGMLTNLVKLNLQENLFSGTIPSIRNLRNLELLNLTVNNLSGPVPAELGKLYSLTTILWEYNNLSGPIPPSIGDLANLNELRLAGNELSGLIPSALGNLTKLTVLSLSKNILSGSIPGSLGNLANLQALGLAINNLSGPIPSTFGNLTKLNTLILFGNTLTGRLPPAMDNLTNFESLQLSSNAFTGPLPQQICLGGSLQRFVANGNYFTGPIPTSLKNCSSLIRLNLAKNRLTGNVSDAFGVYPMLGYIELTGNNFYGHLSSNWAECHNLTTLKFSNNNLSGSIPPQLGQAPMLQQLQLSSNHLTGNIPKELGKLTSLFELSISNNQLSGNIPVEIGSIMELKHLDLAANDLSGLIPNQVGGLLNLEHLNLSKNKLMGSIPSEFEQLKYLQSLDISGNLLNGQIPAMLGSLQKLVTLNLSHNNLSGTIPSEFEKMLSLTYVNISYNQLEGPIPNNLAFINASFEALKNNKGLCGNVTGLVPCAKLSQKSKKVVKLVLFVGLGTLMLVLFVVGVSLCIHCQRARKTGNQAAEEQVLMQFSTECNNGKMVYEHIIKVTEEFDEKYLIGEGGYGAVYKAKLPEGQVVAVKKLHSSLDGDLKAFISEVQVLTEIKHHNIVKLYGFCSHPHISFLVYEFLEGGSLDKVLSTDTQAILFDWNRRVNVVKGVASALYHMHHGCSSPIIHRDISSKNILLDLEYEAHISDFGTAKILNPSTHSFTTFAGTYGYAAPELAYTMEVNEKCDVFSFGVLCLEILIGSHPGELISSLFSSSENATQIASNLLLKDVLDQRLPQPVKPEVEEVIFIAKIAFACLSTSPVSRPTMENVHQNFVMRKSPSLGPFPIIALGQLLNN